MKARGTWAGLAVVVAAMTLCGCALPAVMVPTGGASPDNPIHRDDFRSGLGQWAVELERGGRVTARDGVLDIDVPGGATVWFRPVLQGPVVIEYDAVAVDEDGANDRVSDLNAFWMATDPRALGGVPYPRSGAFADYDTLRTYYVGQGGNGNTTTRMRRYVGEPSNRPLLPDHDRTDADDLLVANARQSIRLVAAGDLIQYWRDDRLVFEMVDPDPYQRGWFALRTTASHLRITNFRVRTLPPVRPPA